MSRIAVLTSGGDSPGMNAAIRAAVRCGCSLGLEMFGVSRGFAGLIEGDLLSLDNRAVGGVIERGGTFLRTARSAAFLTKKGQERALDTISSWRIDGIIVIGGNGSLKGAHWLQEQSIPTVGVPASIDNDICGTAMAIGVDTVLNTVVASLNRIRDTAVSHGRAFVVEVMGRNSGYIALMGGLAGGAEIVLIPEVSLSLKEVSALVAQGVAKGKHHSIIVVSEGFTPSGEHQGKKKEEGSAGALVSRYLNDTGTIETRLTILGHLQRGGSPTAFDRILACRLSEAAVDLLAGGAGGVMTALVDQEVKAIPFTELSKEGRNVNLEIYRLVHKLAN